jgi:UDP-N-acetylmuramate dehydrogenase
VAVDGLVKSLASRWTSRHMSAAYSIADNVALRERNTFRIEVEARHLATVHDAAALSELLAEPRLRGLPLLVLGEGSNVLFASERFDGVVVHLGFATAQIIDRDTSTALVRVEAAHRWDPFVDWTLAHGLSGLENLALIPGQCGAAPIQNIGAYGVELRETVASVDAFDRGIGQMQRLSALECAFGYRDSVFRREPDRWIVTALELRLSRKIAPNLAYAGLREELAAMGGLPPTATNVAAAVRRIRRRKLPDPALIGNAGSFFRNPIVSLSATEELTARFPDAPVFAGPDASTRKLSAAWLIDRAGWRGYREGAAGVSAQHALVLVNHGGATGAQLLALARRIAASVGEQYGVPLEPEPRIVGATF